MARIASIALTLLIVVTVLACYGEPKTEPTPKPSTHCTHLDDKLIVCYNTWPTESPS